MLEGAPLRGESLVEALVGATSLVGREARDFHMESVRAAKRVAVGEVVLLHG